MANCVEPPLESQNIEPVMAARFDVRAKTVEIAMWRACAQLDGCRSVSGWARQLLNQRVSELRLKTDGRRVEQQQ